MAHTVIKESELLSPAYAGPLGTALQNTDELYVDWRPPLVDHPYTTNPGITRQSRFAIPVRPSADGVSYYFEHVVLQTGGSGTLTVKVEEWTGAAWNTLENATGIAFSGSTTHTHTDTVAAAATVLRFTYSTSDGFTTYTPDSILVIPTPSAPTGGVLASGHKDYDSGLVTATGGPTNTEMCNRVSGNTAATINDRRQLVLAFAQEDSTSGGANVRHDKANGYKPDGEWMLIGLATASIPFASDGDKIDVDVSATVDAGADTDLVRVSQVGADTAPVLLDADGTVQSAELTLKPDAAGTLGANCTFAIEVNNTSGNTTYLHAVSGYLQAPLPAGWQIVKDVAPPASVSILQAVASIVETWAFRPWAQPAMCFEGNTSGLTTRRFNASIGLGAKHARAWVTRCFAPPGYGAAQSATVIASDSSGGFGGGGADITVPAETSGAEVYLEATGNFGQGKILRSGDAIDDAPAATTNRQIELTEGLSPTVETIEVDYAAGFGLCVVDVTIDRGSL